MRILVAGGQGQVGIEIGLLGLFKKFDMTILGSQDLDVTDVDSVAYCFAKHRPELVINAAAYTDVDKAEGEVEVAYAINQIGTLNLANACNDFQIPMFHISTDYVFDGKLTRSYSETDKVCPMGVYARSKEAGEQVLRETLNEHVILRTSWVFGVNGDNFVKTIVRLARERDRLTIVSDQFGGPSSARGIAAALLELAAEFERSGDIDWGTYHYCQKPYVSWYQFANVIVERATKMGIIDHSVDVAAISSSDFPSPAKRPANSKLDTTKLTSKFNISKLSWLDDLDDVLRQLSN